MMTKYASILIHLDFLSISTNNHGNDQKNESFNPYSPGFSIYLDYKIFAINFQRCFNPYSPGFSIYLKKLEEETQMKKLLQSLFTWIFYLFNAY